MCNICVNIMGVLGSSVLFKGVQRSAQEAWSHMDIKHTLRKLYGAVTEESGPKFDHLLLMCLVYTVN